MIKIAIGLITSKLIAVFIGPGGMALVGNLRNFITSLEAVATLGFQNGIVKYVAERNQDELQLRKIIATAFTSLTVVAILLSIMLLFTASYCSELVFGQDYKYDLIFKVLALALPWYAVSLFFVSVINGLGKFRQVVYINIIGNVMGLLVTAILIWQFKTLGALLSIVITPAMLFFVTFYMVNRELDFYRSISFSLFDSEIIRNLSSYSLMALVSAVLGPLVYLAIRNKLIVVRGIESAGYWEAITRISTYYLMFISTVLAVYYLPKLAAAKSDKQSRLVFLNYYKGIMPMFVGGLVAIYFLRDFIIYVLFTSEFNPVRDLFLWQLVGDVFKAASMILGFQFFAARLTSAFIITELLSLLVLYTTSFFLIALIGVEGVVMAHAITYVVYFAVLVVYFRRKLF